MQIYQVGGAVRDRLLKRPIHDIDWVVVGSTPEAMLEKGFLPVGKDFPVFLHPKTKEEYALARTEKKTGHGYTGFCVHAAPDVTLEADLSRRDLTINAMALDDKGQLVDPYGGQSDLEQKQLRHVSAAFSQDPVRLLRIARFAAQLPTFQIAAQTQQLLEEMVQAGEVAYLVAERVWAEFHKALAAPAPHRFIQVLAKCHALEVVAPALCSYLNPTAQHHAILSALDTPTQALAPSNRFALLCLPLKATELRELGQSLKIPKIFQRTASSLQHLATFLCTVSQLPPEALGTSVLKMLQQCQAIRQPSAFTSLLTTLDAAQAAPTALLQHLRVLQQSLHQVQGSRYAQECKAPAEIAQRIAQAQLACIEDALIQNILQCPFQTTAICSGF